MNSNSYTSESIEVLTGLEPVKRRPGMYTDTTRPNHLAHEVIDNSVDEAIAGFAKIIEVTLHVDDSLEVRDNGRGMPVDLHPEEKIPGVELILSRLHAGAKFSNKNYQFSGGLHGVGVSVVNALSEKLETTIMRDAQKYTIEFKHGELTKPLSVVGTVGKRNTGTIIRFWPCADYFDSAKFSVQRLRHTLRAKAVLCPGLLVHFHDASKNISESWQYSGGLRDYLVERSDDCILLPAAPFTGTFKGRSETVDWAVAWLPEAGEIVTESYVNLIPTPQGGTHVNGFRTGLLASLREFCEFRNLVPRGIKICPEDIWERCGYVLSVKIQDPQFSGQTKERLSSKESAAFVSGVVKDAFSLWLNQHTEEAEQIADIAIQNAHRRMRAVKQVTRKKNSKRTGPAGEISGLCRPGPRLIRTLFSGRRFRGWVRQTGKGPPISGHHAPPGENSQHLGNRRRSHSKLQRNP